MNEQNTETYDTQRELQAERQRQIAAVDPYQSYRIWPANPGYAGISAGVRFLGGQSQSSPDGRSMGSVEGLAADAEDYIVEDRRRQLLWFLNSDGRQVEVGRMPAPANRPIWGWKMAYTLEPVGKPNTRGKAEKPAAKADEAKGEPEPATAGAA